MSFQFFFRDGAQDGFPKWPKFPSWKYMRKELSKWTGAYATATRSAMGASLADSGKFFGGVVGADGKIYGIPSVATDVLIIDPVAGTASRNTFGLSLTGSSKWTGGVLAPNGKIYCMPYGAVNILIIDTIAGTASRSTMGASFLDSNKFSGGVLGPDGKIYGIPNNSTDILIIDPAIQRNVNAIISPYLNKY
mgnify:CR=1 FL=1